MAVADSRKIATKDRNRHRPRKLWQGNAHLIMANQTSTIDSQVHAYDRNSSTHPWIGVLQGPDEVTGDDMVAVMDKVDVDGSLLIAPFWWIHSKLSEFVFLDL